MRRSKTITLAEALKDYIDEMKIGGKLNEAGVINSWEETVWKSNKQQDFKNIYER